jgi:hypothetical protein
MREHRRHHRLQRGRQRALIGVVVATALTSCSGGGSGPGARDVTETALATAADSAPPATSTAAPTTAAESTTEAPTEAPSTTASPTTTDPVPGELTVALAPLLGSTIGSFGFAEPEPDCLGPAVDALPRSARHTVERLIGDPDVWAALDGDDRYPVLVAYLACVDADVLANYVVIATLRTIDRVGCVRNLWGRGIEPAVLASSLAYGDGFDDLPPAAVDGLTAAAVACVPDPAWWIEDEASVLAENGTAPADARCVATAYVDELGIEAVIRRRILTFDFVAASPDQLAAIDLPGRCAMEAPSPIVDLGVVPGDCVTGFGQGAGSVVVVRCDQHHNGEIVSSLDLTTVAPAWPGAQALVEDAARRCAADITPLVADRTGYGAGWDLPDRWSWESSARTLTCVLVQDDFASWAGPSGIVPTTPVAGAPPAPGERVTDFGAIPIGTCVRFLTPTPADAGTAVEVAGCDESHSAELFHAFSLAAEPGAPFPGPEQVAADADAGCTAGFSMYVGVPIEQSRLSFLFLHPVAESWEQDPSVYCILTTSDGSALDHPMAGSRE